MAISSYNFKDILESIKTSIWEQTWKSVSRNPKACLRAQYLGSLSLIVCLSSLCLSSCSCLLE